METEEHNFHEMTSHDVDDDETPTHIKIESIDDRESDNLESNNNQATEWLDFKEERLETEVEVNEEMILQTFASSCENKTPQESRNSIEDDKVILEKTLLTINNSIKKDPYDNSYCERCGSEIDTYCCKCSILASILDNSEITKTGNKASESLPKNILAMGDTSGVYALKSIPSEIIFGPFEGIDSVPTVKGNMWKLKGARFIVPPCNAKRANWMQFVNCTTNISEENLRCFQHEGDVFFRSIREIRAGEELLLYPGKTYLNQLGTDQEMYFRPTKERPPDKVYACTLCCLSFKQEVYLVKHKLNCANKWKVSMPIPSLIQCDLCKVYLCEKEYNDYHVNYCHEKFPRVTDAECEFTVPDSPPDASEGTATALSNILPMKSKMQYEQAYKEFREWCKRKGIAGVSENVLLAYFEDKSRKVKSSTLWTTYSMLKSTLNIKENVDINRFPKVIPYLKKKSVGYRAQKLKIFTRNEIETFLLEADDDIYLMMKVALIMGIAGGCRRDELIKLTIDDIIDTGSLLTVKVAADSATHAERTFTVSNSKYIQIYRKYAALRPSSVSNRRFFLKYMNGKCYKQLVGINKMGTVPKLIAKSLGLPNEDEFTGHCFRRTSATLTANKADNNGWNM